MALEIIRPGRGMIREGRRKGKAGWEEGRRMTIVIRGYSHADSSVAEGERDKVRQKEGQDQQPV